MAKKCGSKWELGKMERALNRMWQKSVGLNGNLQNGYGKVNQDLAKKCGSKWELGKNVRVLIGTM